jgi:hypothetical protein
MLTAEEDNIKKVKIQIPTEYQNKHEELTIKHHDVFSKIDQDIGKAKHFEHN